MVVVVGIGGGGGGRTDVLAATGRGAEALLGLSAVVGVEYCVVGGGSAGLGPVETVFVLLDAGLQKLVLALEGSESVA